MKTWGVFIVGLLVAIAGLTWVSATMIRLDRNSRLSESSRLALWRMDLSLARLLAAESTRPTSDYAPGSMALSGGGAQHVLLHFDVSERGLVTTPQRGLDDRLAHLRPALKHLVRPVPIADAVVAQNDVFITNAGEFNRRNTMVQRNFAPAEELRLIEDVASEASMAPAWYGELLVLVRRVRLADGIHVQGLWLDWTTLRPALLGEVKDLLPRADLEPVAHADRGDALMLASLPVRLVPGTAGQLDEPEGVSIGWVLFAAWASLAVVAGALGTLLFGALALDARRAAFVSAVTHELRTPLTTFKLYAEMLEDGMVPPDKQKEYLGTLRQEANRLGYLVENVLAYAQIEKGRRQKPLEQVPLPKLIERIVPRLQARAAQAQFTLDVAEVPAVGVMADPVSVEQILFNLVDNACKYAASATDKRIAIAFTSSASKVQLAVSDSGPGVAAEVARKLFEPFRKSAAEAAEGAQGIGLGLSLSRRLARAMGGDLVYRANSGASFELSLLRG